MRKGSADIVCRIACTVLFLTAGALYAAGMHEDSRVTVYPLERAAADAVISKTGEYPGAETGNAGGQRADPGASGTVRDTAKAYADDAAGTEASDSLYGTDNADNRTGSDAAGDRTGTDSPGGRTGSDAAGGGTGTDSPYSGTAGTMYPGVTGQGLVDINTASAAELKTLKGIGDSKAGAIISYREEHGGFSCIEDIMLVPGIKEGTFGKIRDSICVSGKGMTEQGD